MLMNFFYQRRIRKLGRAGKLPGPDANLSPEDQFNDWFSFAQRAGLLLPEAMAISTLSDNGLPSSRMVLMKEFNAKEIVFYSNYQSRKGNEIAQNPNVALLFHWQPLQRQIRIEGRISKIAPDRSDRYFESRDRLSRLGALASAQSETVDSRATLEARLDSVNQKYPANVPRPKYWGGYAVSPRYYEFWQGRDGRIHDRIAHTLEDDTWVTNRLQP